VWYSKILNEIGKRAIADIAEKRLATKLIPVTRNIAVMIGKK